MSDFVAYIPARGGSKRVKNKNLQEVGGVSLVRRAAICALESGIFSRVFVSTDSDEIANEVKDLASIDWRPSSLATSEATVIEALRDSISRLNLINTNIGIMLPTCALRSLEDLRLAQNLYLESKGSAVVSVGQYETPVHLAFSINPSGALQPIFPDAYRKSTRSVDHPQAYRFNGAIIFNHARRLIKQQTLVGQLATPYIMPAERSIDIDWLYQLEIARSVADNNSI